MVKIIKILCSIFLLTCGSISASFASNNQSSSNQSNENSFAHLESLERNIEEAGKEISSLRLNSQLNTLRQKAKKMIVDFSVIKIYGFGSSLTALIQFSDNNQLEVTEGQLIEDHYKVDLITKNKVELLDLNTTKKIIVPFI